MIENKGYNESLSEKSSADERNRAFNLTERLQRDIVIANENEHIDYKAGYGDVNYWNINEKTDPNRYRLEAEM